MVEMMIREASVVMPALEGDQMPERAQQAPDKERAARAFRRLLRSFHSTDSYGLVLLMIIATYVLATTLSPRWGATVLLIAQIATVWLALHTSQARRRVRLVANGLFLLAAVAAVANLAALSGSTLQPYVFIAASVLYVVAPFSIVRHIAYRRTVDQETMLGALAAYLLIGMAFAFVYRFLGAVQASTFFGSEGDGTLSDDLFFSFVTLTTTGYGNLVPAGNPGQSLAVLEALMGQLFLVTAVGKLVSAWRPRVWRDAPADTQNSPDRSD
jgi:Ion channel